MREIINYLNKQKLSKEQARQKLRESGNFVKEKDGIRTVKKEAMNYWVMNNGDLLIDDEIKCVSTVEYSWNGKYWEPGNKTCNDAIYNKFSDIFDVSLSDAEIEGIKKIAKRKGYIHFASCWSWPTGYEKKVAITFSNGTLLLRLKSRKPRFLKNKFFKKLNAIYMIHANYDESMLDDTISKSKP